jgi:hypothetical protein
MENFTPIDFHQTRDFSKKMNTSFEFVRQNFKPLAKSIIVISGPPVIIASVIMGSFVGDFMDLATLNLQGGDSSHYFNQIGSLSFWLEILLMISFFMISGVTTIASINNYMILYEEKQSNKIEVSEVWTKVRETFPMYLGTMFLFTIVIMLAYVIMLIPVFLLAAISPWLIFFGVIFFMVAAVYVTISLSLVFFVRNYEKAGFTTSLFRSFNLVKGKWWSTFGLIMILYTIVAFVSNFIFMIPYYAVMIPMMLHNVGEPSVAQSGGSMAIFITIFFAIFYLVQMVMYTFPNVGIAFQYFNLVEMKEARGLMQSIDTFDQPPAPSSSQDEHY